MLSLGKTIANLTRHRRQWDKLWKMPPGLVQAAEPPASPLREVKNFGLNPGRLRMLTFVPEHLPPSPALVVVLHGCTQSAAGYDYGAGWSTLAERYGFICVLPEQQFANNPKRCFNWFRLADSERGRGEAASIRQMVEKAVADHGVDCGRIFVTGLSAGGAMTSVMLATYPDVFAAGAIIAGLPYRAANNVPQAYESMFQGVIHSAREWGDLVRRASPHKGPWPRVSVWHGDADATVAPVNAGEIIKQWTDVHGLDPAPTLSETVDGYPRQVWRNKAGDATIESYTITSMAHGTPLAVGDGDGQCGTVGAFLLDVGISSSYHIAKFFGLTTHKRSLLSVWLGGASLVPDQPATAPRDGIAAESTTRHVKAEAEPAEAPPSDGHANDRTGHIESVITKALKAAGLMKP